MMADTQSVNVAVILPHVKSHETRNLVIRAKRVVEELHTRVQKYADMYSAEAKWGTLRLFLRKNTLESRTAHGVTKASKPVFRVNEVYTEPD